jgi:aryl-alcohol dehydrogenase-like predicted oxidoreductase
MSMPTLALAWVLRRTEVASAITGASRPEQVHANAAASGVNLSDDLLAAADEALGGVPITRPTLAPNAQPGIKHR